MTYTVFTKAVRHALFQSFITQIPVRYLSLFVGKLSVLDTCEGADGLRPSPPVAYILMGDTGHETLKQGDQRSWQKAGG